MASPPNPQPNDNLPLVLVHRLPQFSTTFNHWLQPHFRILEPSDPSFSTRSKTVRALFCVGPTPVNSETLDQFPSVECVVGSSAGIDHIDLAECNRRRVMVANAGDAFSEDVADYAVGLLIDVLRRVSAADRFVRGGLWAVNGEYPLGSKVGGKRIGIVGLGSIGSVVAKRLEPFGCIIAYNSRRKKLNVPFPYYSKVQDLATNSDALILCCSLTSETRHLINKDVMMALGKKGVVINVGRGALVDEKELVEFLVQGQIAGAGLDVFEDEPNVPKELFGLDNVVLSPHKAVTTPESIEQLRKAIVGNLDAFFANKPLLSQVKFE
ncbi:hypothetical protein LguiB_034624 [Lonicera macranthoides]